MLNVSSYHDPNCFRQSMTVIRSQCSYPLTLMTSLTAAITMVMVARGICWVTLVMGIIRDYH